MKTNRGLDIIASINGVCPTPQPDGTVHRSTRNIDGHSVTWTRLDGWVCDCLDTSRDDCSHISAARTQ